MLMINSELRVVLIIIAVYLVVFLALKIAARPRKPKHNKKIDYTTTEIYNKNKDMSKKRKHAKHYSSLASTTKLFSSHPEEIKKLNSSQAYLVLLHATKNVSKAKKTEEIDQVFVENILDTMIKYDEEKKNK